MTRLRRSWPWWRWLLTGLITLALALSGYLSWHYLVGGLVIGCGGGSSCDEVLSSRWSSVGGLLPISGLAAGAYLAMLLASLCVGPATEAPVRRLAWRAMLVLVGAAAGSAVWFTIVQKWVIGAFCPYCLATHITGVLLAALVIWQAPRQFHDDSIDAGLMHPAPALPDDGRKPEGGGQRTEDGYRTTVRPSVLRRLSSAPYAPALVGLALAGILATSQVALNPKTVSLGGESQSNLPALDPHVVPLIGSPNAPYVVTLLYDYKCPHCQQLHWMLGEAIRRYGDKLAFALCPAPLNTNCNPYVPRNVNEFADSCELAKVGLAVWVANREAFPVFDRWMFSFESGDRWHPRSLDAARTKAVALVGQAKFAAALTNPWIDRYMQTSIRIYGATVQSGKGGVPKLVFRSRWVIPQPNDTDDLLTILQNSLGLPSP